MAADRPELKEGEQEVHYFDADMNPCSEEDARFADVHTIQDGEELHYWLDREAKPTPAAGPDTDKPWSPP